MELRGVRNHPSFFCEMGLTIPGILGDTVYIHKTATRHGDKMLVQSIANQIQAYAELGKAPSRKLVERRIVNILKDMRTDDLLTTAEWSALDGVVYGLAWYVQTGRATVEIEQELAALSGRKYLCLIAKMYLDGVTVSGNVGQWLQAKQGCYRKLAA